jgi:RimJ/RimL family protein N-acetyltransferase
VSGAPLISLRRARPADADALLRWRNDEVTRAFSFNSDEVSAAEHARWLEQRLTDSDCLLWIAECGGESIGQVRVDRRGAERAEISIAIAPEHRGRGHAERVIMAAVDEVRRQRFASELVARIKPENARSLAAFSGAGFQPFREEPGCVELVAEITASPR